MRKLIVICDAVVKMHLIYVEKFHKSISYHTLLWEERKESKKDFLLLSFIKTLSLCKTKTNEPKQKNKKEY